MRYLDKVNKTGIITLNYGHALILGHKPGKLALTQVNEKIETERQEIASLGLFDNATPNYTTYYPDVTAADLAPQDADFIYPVFRMLSETILSKGVPIDFGKKGVLKNSMNMMVGQTINVDHETALGNAIGVVTEVVWQNSYKTASGKTVPAGFNAVLKIDGKSNPRIARGIMMSPPSIHSNSVTVRFSWEPSHTFENEHEFYDKLGTYDKDGSLVRLVVSNIKQYSETSLVAHGADPYAQKIGADGKIVNPEYASTVYSFKADKLNVNPQFIDYKDDSTFSFDADTIPITTKLNNNNNENNQSMTIQELIAGVETQFGLESGSITVENFTEQLSAAVSNLVPKSDLDALATELSDAKLNLETKEGEVQTLTGEVQTLKDEAVILTANAMPPETVQATRDEAIKLYKLIKGDAADSKIIESINKMDFSTSESFKEQYKIEANEKFPDTCQECKSTNISRASAVVDNTDDSDEKVKSNLQARQEIITNNRKKKQSIALGYNKQS